MSPVSARLLSGLICVAAAVLVVTELGGLWDRPEVVRAFFGSQFVLFTLMLAVVYGVALQRGVRVRRLQEQLLAEQNDALSSHQAAWRAHGMVLVTRTDGVIREVSESFASGFGYSSEDLVGQPPGILFAEGDEDPDALRLMAHADIRTVWSGELRMKTRSDEIRLVQASAMPLLDGAGAAEGRLLVMTDVTATRRSEERRTLARLLDLLDDYVYVFEVGSLRMHYMNRVALEQHGFSESDLAGKSIFDLDPNLTAETIASRIWPLLSGTKDVQRYMAMFNGREIEAMLRIHRGADGVNYFVAVARDVTERNELDTAKREFISIVSHELRTPLTSIKGALSLLQSGVTGDLSDRSRAVVEIASRNSDRMLSVVNDILDIEKVEAGKMELAEHQVDLRDLLNEAQMSLHAYADNMAVRFDCKGCEAPAWVIGDPGRLMQVMMNLMSNAAKHSPENGVVSLRIEDTGPRWRVLVSDTGPGLAPEDRDRVFEKFTQLNSGGRGATIGTGLGLAIVRAIVERHGGCVDVESAPGHGSTFFFDLPKAGDIRKPLPPKSRGLAAE